LACAWAQSSSTLMPRVRDLDDLVDRGGLARGMHDHRP
jgi:hypothetical protein